MTNLKQQYAFPSEFRKIGYNVQNKGRHIEAGGPKGHKVGQQETGLQMSLPKIKGNLGLNKRLQDYDNNPSTLDGEYDKIIQQSTLNGLRTTQVRSNKITNLQSQHHYQNLDGSAQYRLAEGEVVGQETGFSNNTYQINADDQIEAQPTDRRNMTIQNIPIFENEKLSQRRPLPKARKLSKLRSPAVPADGFKSQMHLNAAADRQLYSSSAQSMSKKRVNGPNFAERSSSVSNHPFGPIRNAHGLPGSQTLRRSGAKSANKHQTSRRRIGVNNSNLPKNPYFEAQLSSLVSQNQYQNYYSKNNNAWKNTRRISDEPEESQTYFQGGGAFYPGQLANIDKSPLKTTIRSMSDVEHSHGGSGYFIGGQHRDSSRLTLADIQRIAEQNKQITHQMTNSNISVTSEVERQQQSKLQIQQNMQIIKMLKLANNNLTQYRAIMKDSPVKAMKKQVKGLESIVKEASRESSLKKIGYGQRSLRKDGGGSTERSNPGMMPMGNLSKSSIGNTKLSREVLKQGRIGSRNTSNQQSRTVLSSSDHPPQSLSVVTKENLQYINDNSTIITPQGTGRSVKPQVKRQLRARKASKHKDNQRRNASGNNPNGHMTQHYNPAQDYMKVIQESNPSNTHSHEHTFERDHSSHSQAHHTNEQSLNPQTQRDAGDYSTFTHKPTRKQFHIPAIDMTRLEQTLKSKGGRKVKKNKGRIQASDQYTTNGRNPPVVHNFSEAQLVSGSNGPFETQRNTLQQVQRDCEDEQLAAEKILEKHRIIPAKKSLRRKKKEQQNFSPRQGAKMNPVAEIAALKAQKQNIDAHAISHQNNEKRNAAQEPQAVTKMTNLVGLTSSVTAFEIAEAQNSSEVATVQAQQSSILPKGYRLPNLNQKDKSQAQLKREYHQQEFKRHAAQLREEQSIPIGDDYQIKQEPNIVYFSNVSQTKQDSHQDTGKNGKKGKSHNYANTNGTISPYSKDSKHAQSIESALGLQNQDYREKRSRGGTQLPENKAPDTASFAKINQSRPAGVESGYGSQRNSVKPSLKQKVDIKPTRAAEDQQKESSLITQSMLEHEGGMNSTITSILGNSRLENRVNKSNLDQYSLQLTSLTNSARQKTRQEQQRDLDGRSVSQANSSKYKKGSKINNPGFQYQQYTNVSIKTGTKNDPESPSQLYYQNKVVQNEGQKVPGFGIQATKFNMDRIRRLESKQSQQESNQGRSSRFSQRVETDQTPKNVAPVVTAPAKSRRTKYAKHCSVDSSASLLNAKKNSVDSQASNSVATELTNQAGQAVDPKIPYDQTIIDDPELARVQLIVPDSNGSVSGKSSSKVQNRDHLDLGQHLLRGSSLTRIVEEEQKLESLNAIHCMQIGGEVLLKSRPATNQMLKTDSAQEPYFASSDKRSTSLNKNSVEDFPQVYFNIQKQSSHKKRNTKSQTSIMNQEINRDKKTEIQKEASSRQSSYQSSYPEIIAVSARLDNKHTPRRTNPFQGMPQAIPFEKPTISARGQKDTNKKLTKTQIKIEKEMKTMSQKLSKIQQEIQYRENKFQTQRQRQDYEELDPLKQLTPQMHQSLSIEEQETQFQGRKLLNMNSGNNSQTELTNECQQSQNQTQQLNLLKNPQISPRNNEKTSEVQEHQEQYAQDKDKDKENDKYKYKYNQEYLQRTSKSQQPQTARTVQYDVGEQSGMVVIKSPLNKKGNHFDQKLKQINKEKKQRQKQKKAINKEIKKQNEQLRNNVHQLKHQLETGVQKSKLMTVFDKIKEAQEMKRISKQNKSQLERIRNLSCLGSSPKNRRQDRSPRNLSARIQN